MELLTWLIDNIGGIVAGATLILGGLAILAKMTKSPTDDKWIAKMLAFLRLVPVPKKEK